MRSDTVRLALSSLAVSLWLALLLAGVGPAVAVHLLLAAALGLFPWRRAGKGRRAARGSEEPPPGPPSEPSPDPPR